MNRITRAAIVGALASAVALGVTGPADAASGGKSGHHKVHAAKSTKAGKAEKGGKSATAKAAKAAKAEQQLTRAKRKLTGEITRKNRFLGHLLERHGVARLDDVMEAALRANVEGDRATLGVLRIAVNEAATREELQELAADARGVRPERYNTIVSQLRKAGELLAVADGNAAATSALDAVRAELMTYTARTSRADLQAAQQALAAVAGMLEDETGETGTGDTGETSETDTGETGETDSGETDTEPVPAV
jgi:hypothetical protein